MLEVLFCFIEEVSHKKLIQIIQTIEAEIYQLTIYQREKVDTQFFHCSQTNSATTCYTHLNELLEIKTLPQPFLTAVSELLSLLLPKVQAEWEHKDCFGNQVLNAQFETELAYFILKEGCTDSLEIINQSLIAYLNKHIYALRREQYYKIIERLEHYKLPYETGNCPINSIISLLSRSLLDVSEKERIQILCETFVVHLMFFDYVHLYQPERDAVSFEQRKIIANQREKTHRLVRPENAHELFEKSIRGRINVFSQKKSADFGICEKTHTKKNLKMCIDLFIPLLNTERCQIGNRLL